MIVFDRATRTYGEGHTAVDAIREISLSVDVGVGDGRASVWTCDLTHGYIEINAGYRT